MITHNSTYNYKDKVTNVRNLNMYMLNRTLKMFEYEGLPETIPVRELEKILQMQGYAYFTEVNGELYALHGGLGGERDAYYHPTTITISNPWLNFTKTLNIVEDGVMMNNDDMMLGLAPLYDKYNTLMVENDITMVLNSYNNRIQTLIAAGDDQTKESAEEYLKQVAAGEQGIIAEQRIFDGVSVHNSSSNIASNTMALTEFHQYLKASLLNELGLDANFNMKRERLTAGEVAQNDEGLYPLVMNMLYNRRKAVQEINEKYGTNITVAFGSVWKNRNLDGELSRSMAMAHTEDMEEGQIDQETLQALDAFLATMGGQPVEEEAPAQEEVQEETPVVTTEPEAEEAPLEEAVESVEEEVAAIGLSEEALNKDLDDLAPEDRLEVYDLLFSIDDESDLDEAAGRIAEILEGQPEEEVEDAEVKEEEAATEEPVETTEETEDTEEEPASEPEAETEEEESTDTEEVPETESEEAEVQVEEEVVEEIVEAVVEQVVEQLAEDEVVEEEDTEEEEEDET